ncbi:hypothetical protein [Desulfotomaculum nigrificans]|uniref:hypothetical protein n=1 Tax=Desulfotomaculum nigrificans TaxID=1565 RepID=UPI0001FADDE0|nr:hypothetical protein [Desulfotomaculum nigrificans]
MEGSQEQARDIIDFILDQSDIVEDPDSLQHDQLDNDPDLQELWNPDVDSEKDWLKEFEEIINDEGPKPVLPNFGDDKHKESPAESLGRLPKVLLVGGVVVVGLAAVVLLVSRSRPKTPMPLFCLG